MFRNGHKAYVPDQRVEFRDNMWIGRRDALGMGDRVFDTPRPRYGSGSNVRAARALFHARYLSGRQVAQGR
jgi:hypothetical protein